MKMLKMNAPEKARARGNGRMAEQVDAVVRASRALVGIAAASLMGIEDVVTVPQWRVLVLLHTRGPMNLASVATELGVNPSNASRTCDRLTRAGLLNRRESELDRRNITLTLTAAGRRLVQKVTRQRRTAIEKVLQQMAVTDRDRLAEALSSFAEVAGEAADDDTVVGRLWPPQR